MFDGIGEEREPPKPLNREMLAGSRKIEEMVRRREEERKRS